MDDRDRAIQGAIAGLRDDQFTDSGKPLVDAINDQIQAAGHAPVSAWERDQAWDLYVDARGGTDAPESADDATEAPADDSAVGDATETLEEPGPNTESPESDEVESTLDDIEVVGAGVAIRVTEAPMDPVPLHVHGVGRFELWVGKTVTIPVEALDTLRNSDVQFEEV